MPTVLACLRRSVERMWLPRVPTRFGPGTRLRRPKNQWNQGPLATPQAEMCPRTANSGLAETGRASERGRDLPAHVMVYYAVALALYTDSGTREVLRCLLEGLRWLWGAEAGRV